jgi:hypothetical protein
MKTRAYLLLPFVLLVLLAGSCKKDDPAPVDLGYGYFPGNVGRWIEYQVDSLSILNADSSVWSYEIREELTENFTDLEGRPAQRVVRYARDPTTGGWAVKDVWWQTRDNARAERSEENRRLVKLVFPPRSNTLWNINSMNTQDAFELTYDDLDKPWSVNGLSFDSTVVVTGTYEPNLINTKTYRERYAKNVGLVHRLVDSSETQFAPPTFVRHRVEYTVTAYGQ